MKRIKIEEQGMRKGQWLEIFNHKIIVLEKKMGERERETYRIGLVERTRNSIQRGKERKKKKKLQKTRENCVCLFVYNYSFFWRIQ